MLRLQRGGTNPSWIGLQHFTNTCHEKVIEKDADPMLIQCKVGQRFPLFWVVLLKRNENGRV